MLLPYYSSIKILKSMEIKLNPNIGFNFFVSLKGLKTEFLEFQESLIFLHTCAISLFLVLWQIRQFCLVPRILLQAPNLYFLQGPPNLPSVNRSKFFYTEYYLYLLQTHQDDSAFWKKLMVLR